MSKIKISHSVQSLERTVKTLKAEVARLKTIVDYYRRLEARREQRPVRGDS